MSGSVPSAPGASTPPVVELAGVWREFDAGAVVALKGVSLSIAQGELIGLSGPSGSGKSTLINIVCGLDAPTRGAVRFDGIENPPPDRWAELRRRRIGIVFQDFNLVPVLTALENVQLAMFDTGVPQSMRAPTALARLAEVGVAHCANRFPPQLSGGERRRVAIARSLANDPGVLCADEPTSNLDSRNGAMVAELLLGLHAVRKMTMIVVSHDQTLIDRCPRRVAMKDGQIVSSERAATAASSPTLETAPPPAGPVPTR